VGADTDRETEGESEVEVRVRDGSIEIGKKEKSIKNQLSTLLQGQ
jgi:hypothetical protein